MKAVRKFGCVALAGALAATPPAWAARPPPEEPPQLLKLRLSNPYLAFEAERRDNKAELSDGSGQSRDTTMDYTPSAGISLNGSVLHPNVVQFSGSLEEGLTLGKRTYDNGSTRTVDDRSFELQRYNLNVTLLREKPYAATLYGARSTDRRDYGDLQQYTTTSESYGLRLGYRRGRVPTDVSIGHWEETVDDPDRPTFRSENTVNLNAENVRNERNRTTLRGTFNEFRQEESGVVGNDGNVATVSVTDAEYFGKQDRARLNSSLYFNNLDSQFTQTRSLNLREDLHVRHSRHLSSEAAYTFDTTTAGGADTTRHTLEGDLTHQLAASLESKIGALAETIYSGGNSDQRVDRYGPRAGEVYTKQLSTWGRLQLSAGADYFRESQSGGAGGSISVINENIRLADGQPALLNKPGVDTATILVTDISGATLYRQGLDYQIFPRGDFTEIQRVFGGRIPDGTTVHISYTSSAQPDTAVTTLDSHLGAELGLFKDLLKFYVTRREVQSSGGESLTFQNYEDTVAGVRVTRNWVTVGYEHNEHMADALNYSSDRTYEQMNIPLGDSVSLALDASQARIRYPELDELRSIETYHARCQAQMLSSLWASLGGGYYHENNESTERDVKTVEAELSHRIGRLESRLTYRYEDETNAGEQRERNWILLRIVRRF